MKKTALITGASDRIGKTIALQLVQMGYDIALHYNRSLEKAKVTQASIQEAGGTCTLYQANFLDITSTEQLIHQVVDAENLSLLVNNASDYLPSSFTDDKPYSFFDDLLNINFRAPYILSKSFGKRVKKGLIVNVLDTKVAQNQTYHFDYLLTKKFLESLTELSAVELAPHIRVNAVAPGVILPPPGRDQAYVNQLVDKLPLKTQGNPQQIAETIAYFIQSEFVTGQTIFVDGGEHLC